LNKPPSVDLFRVAVDPAQVERLRQSYELGNGLVENPSVHLACALLLEYLNHLPEPLFGCDFYEAILACQETMENLADRIRNTSILLQEAPWYHKYVSCISTLSCS
jgi:hypothetical protein